MTFTARQYERTRKSAVKVIEAVLITNSNLSHQIMSKIYQLTMITDNLAFKDDSSLYHCSSVKALLMGADTSKSFNGPVLSCTVELKWLEQLWNYENLFEAGKIRANEC